MPLQMRVLGKVFNDTSEAVGAAVGEVVEAVGEAVGKGAEKIKAKKTQET